MTMGEANWILWGLALQAGLCPTDRTVLAPMRDGSKFIFQRCGRCHRDWYLDPDTGWCCGWWLTRAGWTSNKAPGY